MPMFTYTALKNNRNLVKGKIEAENARAARDGIRKLGLLPTKIIDESNLDAKSAANSKTIRRAKLTPMSLKDKIEFTTTLQILTATGIPIIETLVFLENNADAQSIRNTAFELRRQIIAGSTLAETLERYRDIFGRVYVGLVKAGEDSGELDKTLERMLELLKKQAAIKSKVVGALIYPCTVIVLAIAVILVMLMFVFPAFEQMFESLDRPMPLPTQMCMAAGKFMKKFWIAPFAFLGLLGFGIYKAFTTEAIKKVIDKYVLRIPLLGDLVKLANFSNFVAVMQVSYDAGIPIVDCLYLSNLTMENIFLKDSILSATSKVQQGIHLSVALRSAKSVPNMLLFMIATGEQSGRLGDMLHHCTRFIDAKLDSIIDAFTKLIEPLMLVFIGFIVAFMALSLYMPLFSAYQQ